MSAVLPKTAKRVAAIRGYCAGDVAGRDAVKRFRREWLAAWETIRFEYELVDAGDRVVMLFDMRMRGRSTGIDVPFGKVAWVFTYRGGLLIHQKFYMAQSEALEAVGLSEQDVHA